ncbi:MAG: hypothetical protein MI922_24175, partial [Bacteroidales bacterium]|nr:hypothetical protein [Bacteroidales bacterium]
AAINKTKLDTNFFNLQRNVVSKAIEDYHKRNSDQALMEEYANQAVMAKLDSLNQKGIYRWNEYIIVIDEIRPSAQFVRVQKGEAIIDADNKLAEYIRINRLGKIKDNVDMGTTVLIAYQSDTGPNMFRFNPSAHKYQYMICYTRIKSDLFTKRINAYLPPLEFEDEVDVQ